MPTSFLLNNSSTLELAYLVACYNLIMKIWRYWVSETRPLTSVSESGSSCVCNFRVTAGSDRSEEEARARLEDIFQELANWNARQCGDEDVAEHRRRLNELHGYFEDGEYARSCRNWIPATSSRATAMARRC